MKTVFLFPMLIILSLCAQAQTNQCRDSLVRDSILFGLTKQQAEKIAPLIMDGKLNSSEVNTFQEGMKAGDENIYNNLNSFKLSESVDELELSLKPNLYQQIGNKFFGSANPDFKSRTAIQIKRFDDGYSVQSHRRTLVFKFRNGSCYLETSLTPIDLTVNASNVHGATETMLNVKDDRKICSTLKTYFNVYPGDEVCSTSDSGQCKELNETVSQIDARMQEIENEPPVKGSGLKTVFAEMYRKNRVRLTSTSLLRKAYEDSCDNFIDNGVSGESSGKQEDSSRSRSTGIQ